MGSYKIVTKRKKIICKLLLRIFNVGNQNVLRDKHNIAVIEEGRSIIIHFYDLSLKKRTEKISKTLNRLKKEPIIDSIKEISRGDIVVPPNEVIGTKVKCRVKIKNNARIRGRKRGPNIPITDWKENGSNKIFLLVEDINRREVITRVPVFFNEREKYRKRIMATGGKGAYRIILSYENEYGIQLGCIKRRCYKNEAEKMS
jgi:hypothetical protein